MVCTNVVCIRQSHEDFIVLKKYYILIFRCYTYPFLEFFLYPQIPYLFFITSNDSNIIFGKVKVT